VTRYIQEEYETEGPCYRHIIEDDSILLCEQDVAPSRRWSLPGGTLEFGETIEQCLVREMKEETGLDISVLDLLYVCDRLHEDNHVVHMTFLIERTGGRLGTGDGLEFARGKIKSVKMVPLNELPNYGFTPTFYELARANFPDKGTYKGNVSNIGL